MITRPGMILLWLAAGCVAMAAAGHPTAAEPAGAVAARETAGQAPRMGTLPFSLDHYRMMVDVECVRPDGSLRKARAWVDTGNQYLIVGEALARDLGLDVSGLKGGAVTGPPVESASPAPGMRLGGLPLEMEGIQVKVHAGVPVWPGVPAEINLPASALRHDQVVFDYPAGWLTVARPGVLELRGEPIPCRVNPETGLFMVTAVVDGDTVQFGVDNGSAGTWVSDSLTTLWATRHPDWPHATGAVGCANFFGFEFEATGALMRLPELRMGGVRGRAVAVLGLDQRLFDWYSTKSAGRVVGLIGANVLRGFRLEIDYPNRMTYWKAGPPPDPHDLDIVGLTLRPEGDGTLVVAGVVTKDGQPTVPRAQPGDRLIRVDGLDCAGATMGQVVDALRGRPGTMHMLLVERGGKLLTVQTTVMRYP